MHFEKVSFKQWCEDFNSASVTEEYKRKLWENIKLPQQGSQHSMGVDLFIPYNATILPHGEIKIVTGVRLVPDCDVDLCYGMMIMPRSGMGCKYGLKLKNTVGVIDADYYASDNEGNIILFMVNPSDEPIQLTQGKAMAQAIITPYTIPDGAKSDTIRNGGFNSTDGGYNKL